MDKLFNWTTMVSVFLALVVYFMVIAPMMAKKSTTTPATNGNGNGATNGNGA